jgi:hypothetical protein
MPAAEVIALLNLNSWPQNSDVQKIKDNEMITKCDTEIINAKMSVPYAMILS